MIEDRLRQHGHGGALGRIEGRIEGRVADGEKLVWVGPSGAKLVVLFVVERLERGQSRAGWAGGRSGCGRRT